MRKLVLDPDSLRVESFDVHLTAGERGTVRGWQYADLANPDGLSGGDCCMSPLCVDTPLASCDGTCSCGTRPKDPVEVQPVGG